MDARCYLRALKELLKERGVTYAQLAHGLRCSLPTVKRALNKPSLPLNRLLEVCGIAKIAPADLHQRAEQLQPAHSVFTDEQDRLFAERPELLDYFLELSRAGTTPADIAERYDLNPRSTALYLGHLAKVGLIRSRAGRPIELKVQPPFGFGPDSRVLKREHERFLRTIVDDVLASGTKGSVAILKSLQLTTEDYQQMVGELESVIHRFSAIAEQSLGRGQPHSWQVALACGTGPKVRARRLPRITS